MPFIDGNGISNWGIESNPFGNRLDIFDAAFWNAENADLLTQGLYPGAVQTSEWAQQVLMTLYQNQWNSEGAKMARMKAAGVNPFLAAQGIAGVGGSNGAVAPSPPSAQGSAASSLNALSNIGNALGNTFSHVSNGVAMLQKLSHEIRNIEADTHKKLIDMGFTENQTRALGIQLKYMDYKERMSCYQALANYDNTKAQYDILKQDYENKKAELEQITASTNLAVSESERNNAQTQLIGLQAGWQQLQNQFFTQNGYVAGTPLFESLRDSMVSGKTLNINELGNLIAGYSESVTFATESARARASWQFRPSNPYEAASTASVGLIGMIRDKFKDYNSHNLNELWKNDVDAAAEFEKAYSSAMDELEDTYDYYRRQYREIRFSSASDSAKAEAKKKRDEAKQQMKEFTRDKFRDILYEEFAKSAKSALEVQ